MSLPIRFNVSTPADVIQAAIWEYGCAIVEGVLSPQDLVTLNKEIAPFLVTTHDDSKNDFLGSHTMRFGRLLYRIPKVRETLLRHPVVISALDRTLLDYSPKYRLYFSGIMHVTAGESTQTLHRDNTPFVNPSPPVVLATMWAAQDFREESGATLFVPGSHKWPDSRCPTQDEIYVADMPAGSVLFYVGNLIHGAGQCLTGTRTGVSIQYAVSWLAEDENQFLGIPIEYAREHFSEDVLRMMGVDNIARHYGTVDDIHPLSFVLQDGVYRPMDAPEDAFINGRVRSLQLTASDEPRTKVDDHQYSVTRRKK